MLEIVSSNHLESLAGRLAELLGRPSEGVDPWQKDTVLVYSRGLERWLSMVLADKWGVCGNIDFLYPGVCLSTILEASLDPDDREKAKAFQVENLQWTIYDLLGDLAGPAAEPVRRYIGDDMTSGRRRLAMSSALAQLFDQYLIYRPGWFADWESGKPGPSKWQGELWCQIVDRLGPMHRLALAKLFVRDFEADTFDTSQLPPRLVLFGISSLAPFFIELLHALGQRMDIHVFFLNPCRHYWGDIRSRKQKISRGRNHRVDPMQLELPFGDDMEFSDLLATGGQMAKDFLDLLLESGPQTSEVFASPTNTGFLGAMQLCLLDGESAVDSGRIQEDLAFPSIQVHSCHSRMREVEIVYQLVLDLLARHRDMEPRDILVMAPRIEDYDSEIDAVFGLGEVATIPYSLADRTMRVGNSVARTWLKLLSLNRGRMEVSAVMELLDCAPLRNRFGISENQIETIQLWIRESRIHWGWDAGFKRELDLPESEQHTWSWGLDRLLLGSALPLNQCELFAGILPCDPIDEQDAELFSGFLDFVEMSNRIHRQLARSRNVAEWISYGHLLLNTCFVGGEEGDFELMEMRQCLLGMEESVVDDGPEIDADVFAAWAENTIQTRPSGGGFLSSGVCFCSLTPMRSIPARAVILLGMNQKDFPKREPNLDLDLRRRQGTRQGDRSRTGESRQMFLEAILSARDYLFFTRIGRDIRLDTELAPSALLSLMTGEMERLFGWAPEKYSWDHPLQPFSAEVFEKDKPAGGYSPSFHAGALALTKDKKKPDKQAIESELPGGVTLDELREFFRSPGAYFLRHHLGAGIRWSPEAMSDHEPLEPDPLSKWKVGDEMLRLLREGHTIEHAEKVLSASGLLPIGADGQRVLGVVRDGIEAIWSEAKDRLRNVDLVEAEVTVESATVHGFVPTSGSERAVARFGKMRGRDVIDTWLQHVFWSATNDQVTSRHYFTDSPVLMFPPMSSGDATRVLDGLVEVYLEGLIKPLRFDPEGSWIYASESKVNKVWAWWRSKEATYEPRVKWLYPEGLWNSDYKPFVAAAGRVFSEPRKRMQHD